ncbi:hypothetical protein PQQ86_39045 [Paraburkholderia sediminicola]|uniref:hypothetical protein n=1 Tax=Paraburkholderia sediminicola TaxID=458836 RepID=UPI0038B9F437
MDNARLSKAERGVWGRPATEEERERLQHFVVIFRRQAAERRPSDVEKLRSIVRRYAVTHGISPEIVEQVVTAKAPRRIGPVSVTGRRPAKYASAKRMQAKKRRAKLDLASLGM